MNIIILLLIICLVTIVHEFGHFFAARLNGVKVEEFAVGMGPKVWSFQPGETAYALRLFPIGGSCRMLGEEEAADGERAFNNKPVWRRMTIILAGVFMNVVLAMVITLAYVSANSYLEPVVTAVSPGMPAEAAGLLPGDRVLKVGGKAVRLYDDMKLYIIIKSAGKPFEMTLERGGERITKEIAPVFIEGENGARGDWYIGVACDQYALGPLYGGERNGGRVIGAGELVSVSWWQTVSYVESVVDGLRGMVTGQFSPRDAAGPIYMGKIIQDNNDAIMASEKVENKAEAIIWSMLQFAAIISANLAVVNLLPIPALDGGRFVLLAIEGVRRKPLNQERVGWVTVVSFGLLMLLAAAVAFSDILKLFA